MRTRNGCAAAETRPVRTPLVGIALATLLALAGCRGAPCSNCGACAPGYEYNYGQPYGTTLAPTQMQGVVQPGLVQPGATIQPGAQYPPGTVPVAPQSMQPGSIYGG